MKGLTHCSGLVAAAGIVALATAMAAGQSASALDRELLADAAARVSFQGSGATSGHDGKQFFLASADGAMKLWVGGMTQFRYTINNRDTTGADEDLTNGFEFNRAKLYVGGTVETDNEFFIRIGFSPSTGDAALDWARMTHKFDNGLELTWGQFLSPFLKEVLTSEQKFLATERSTTHYVFSDIFTQGVMLTHTAEQFRLYGALTDGRRTQNTAYYSPTEADYALTGRVEFKFGEAPFATYAEATSFRETKTGGMLGAALNYQSSGDTANTSTMGGTPATDTDTLAYTADFHYKGGGWNAMASVVGRTIDTGSGADFNDFGAVVQGGVFVAEQWELFARWDAVFPDDDRAAGEDFNTLTFGANHYFFPKSHAAKLTAEVAWFMDDQASASSLVTAPSTFTDLLTSSEDDQWAFHLQMQLVF